MTTVDLARLTKREAYEAGLTEGRAVVPVATTPVVAPPPAPIEVR